MNPNDAPFEVSRRAMLSAFPALPALPIFPTTALAQLSASPAGQTPATDSLPTWNDTAPKKAILDFVERVTKQGSPDFVPEAERIATFDYDDVIPRHLAVNGNASTKPGVQYIAKGTVFVDTKATIFGTTGATIMDPCFPQFHDIVAACCDLTRHTLRGTMMRWPKRRFILNGTFET